MTAPLTNLQYEQQISTSKIVPEYQSRFFAIRNLFWSRINNAILLAKIKSGYRILDLGMGSGNLLKVLAESNPAAEMHGTDFNVNIKKIDNARVTISDCRKLPYKSSSFDVVFALYVL